MVCGLSWEGLKGVKDIMEELLNLAALEFFMRPHYCWAALTYKPKHNLSG